MMVSVDIPDEMHKKIEALIEKSAPPRWPFDSKTIRINNLTPKERRKYADYKISMKKYEDSLHSKTGKVSRGSVIRMIIQAYFELNLEASVK